MLFSSRAIRLELRLDFVPGSLLVMRTYLHDFPLSLSLSPLTEVIVYLFTNLFLSKKPVNLRITN